MEKISVGTIIIVILKFIKPPVLGVFSFSLNKLLFNYRFFR